jgi:hypothetical protein
MIPEEFFFSFFCFSTGYKTVSSNKVLFGHDWIVLFKYYCKWDIDKHPESGKGGGSSRELNYPPSHLNLRSSPASSPPPPWSGIHPTSVLLTSTSFILYGFFPLLSLILRLLTSPFPHPTPSYLPSPSSYAFLPTFSLILRLLTSSSFILRLLTSLFPSSYAFLPPFSLILRLLTGTSFILRLLISPFPHPTPSYLSFPSSYAFLPLLSLVLGLLTSPFPRPSASYLSFPHPTPSYPSFPSSYAFLPFLSLILRLLTSLLHHPTPSYSLSSYYLLIHHPTTSSSSP